MRVQCPQCATVVVATGGAPVCTNCGFGRAMTPPTDYQAPQKSSSMAVAGLTLSIVTVVISLIPFVNFISPITWLLGLIFSIIGMSQTKNNAMGGRGMAIAGLIISLIGVVLMVTVVLAAVVFVLVSDLGETQMLLRP